MMLSEAWCEADHHMEGESTGQHRPHSSAVEMRGKYLNIFTEEPRSLVSLTPELAELRSKTQTKLKFLMMRGSGLVLKSIHGSQHLRWHEVISASNR